MEDCIFCKIAQNQLPSFKIWENKDFIAFLDIFPAVEGMTLVIPKKHYDSYLIDLDEDIAKDIITACQTVGKILDKKLENALRCEVVFEGMDINHLHAKLIPVYNKGVSIEGVGERANDDELKALAEKLRG